MTHSLSNLGNRKEVRRSSEETYSFRVLFIDTIKRLKDYYVPIN
jgi:hypothetical protein